MLNKTDKTKLPPDHPLFSLSKDKFVAEAEKNKFSAKLEFPERCAILGLVRAGVDRRIAAVAFGVDRRTVSHITNTQSIHYKDVRREFDRLGAVDFTVQYVTPEVVSRVEAAKLDPITKLPDAAARKEAPHSDVPNPRAKGKAGINVVKPEQCSKSHRLEIQFFNQGDWKGMVEPMQATGWYYRDLDSSMPDDWFHNGPESLLTSQNCLRLAEANLTDD